MKKRIVAFAIFLMAVSMLSGGTFAYFTDQATNTANVFKAATVDIQTWSPLGVGGTNLAPGESPNAHSDVITIDLSRSTIETKLSMTVTIHDDIPGHMGDSLSEGLFIDSITYGGNVVVGGITFDQLVGPTGTKTYDIGIIPAGALPNNLVINWHFPSGPQDNNYQGTSFMLDFTFTTKQNI
ncbi:MAG: TasA family protein [Bacillota bacterium]